MNPGNSGHRYKLPAIINVGVDGAAVYVQLGCGHIQVKTLTYAPEAMAAWWQKQVGKRERCYECVVLTAAKST